MSFKFNAKPVTTTTTTVSFKIQPSPSDSPFSRTQISNTIEGHQPLLKLNTEECNSPAENLFLFSPSPRILKKKRDQNKVLSISLPPIRKSVGFGPCAENLRKRSDEEPELVNQGPEEPKSQLYTHKRSIKSVIETNSLLKTNESYLNDVYHDNKLVFLRKKGKVPEIFKKPKQNDSIFIQFNKKKLLIQPKFMEEKGSMCLTELWGDKQKKILIHANEFNKIMDANSLRTVPVNKEYISVYNKYKIENELNMYKKLLDLKGGIKVNKPGVDELVDGIFKNEIKSKNSRFAARRFSEFYSTYSKNMGEELMPSTVNTKVFAKEKEKADLASSNKRDALKRLSSQILINENQSGFYNNFSDLLAEHEREKARKHIKATFVELENLKQHIQVVLDGNSELEKDLNTKQKEVKNRLKKIGNFKFN